jgi:hypothetical protein
MKLAEAKWMLLPAWLIAPLLLWSGPVCSGSVGEPVWKPPSVWDASTGLFRAGDVPEDYNPALLTLGRSIYVNLQRARQAAVQKQATNLTVALEEARDSIHRLRLPTDVLALDAQMQAIRNDLHDTGKQPDTSLWVPVEAQIDKVMAYAPAATGSRVREALHKGRTAAGQGDARAAESQLDAIAASMQYSLGIFPINQVRTDLSAALRSATERPEPDWDGALDAVQDALATFRWYTEEPTYGLLAAHHDLMRAYALARGMRARPEQWRQTSEYLDRARRILQATPGGWGLARLTRDSMYKVELHSSDAVSAVKYALNALQAEIQHQRRQAEDGYRKPIW